MIVDLGHRAHRRAGVFHRVALIDRDGGRDAFHSVDARLVHAVEELTRVGREAFDVAALTFRIERVERQGGFARTGYAGHRDEGAKRQIEIDVLEVVLTRSADAETHRIRSDVGALAWRRVSLRGHPVRLAFSQG